MLLTMLNLIGVGPALRSGDPDPRQLNRADSQPVCLSYLASTEMRTRNYPAALGYSLPPPDDGRC
jgi:hypothetical protein